VVTAPDHGSATDGGTPGGPARRGVLEGLGVAVVAGIGGFAWFRAVGPPSEAERERLEDEQDERQDELEDEQDDQQDQLDEQQDELEDEQDDQDDDRSGPDRGRG
jgi:hypothetical protein